MVGVFKFREKNIGYFDYGKGSPVFLIHGYLETAGVWENFGNRLVEVGYRVIMPELPGHGRSELYGAVHTMEFMADSLKGLIEHLGLDRVFMAGHSMGGYVTLAFADLYPDHLCGYSLLHSHPNADSPQALGKRKSEIEMVEKGEMNKFVSGNIEKMYSSANLEQMKDAVLRSKKLAATISGPAIVAVLRGMMQRPSRLKVLESSEKPFLWILGEKDNYINCREVLQGVILPGNAKSIVLENSGHLGFIEEEDRTVKLLTDFAGPLFRSPVSSFRGN
jgi:pimeloyl-ACP methyl ester carboxylesterase